MRLIYLHIFLICMILAGCGHDSETQKKFAEIDRICEEDTATAMSMLKSIDYRTLSEKDRHRHDLLNIKTRDKAYKRHSSDSLVLDVIDYYSSHLDQGFYPEALYYGGRVYADMGDAEKAIAYFQDALDAVSDNKEARQLKGNIYSQIGRLLDDLRQHKEAIINFEKAIECCYALKDSSNLVYDLLSLSTVHLHDADTIASKKDIDEALRYIDAIPVEDKAWVKVQLASNMAEVGKHKHALAIIRENLNLVDSTCYNYALANAADIYRINEILDTAYIYAKELAISQDINNRITGYDVLFSPQLINIVPKDTLISYISSYKQNVDDYLERHGNEDAIDIHKKYNYDIHVREKQEVIKKNNELLIIVIVLSFIFIIMSAIFLFFDMKNKIKLEKAMCLIQAIFLKMYETGMIDVVKTEKINDFHLIECVKPKVLPFYAATKTNILKDNLLSKLDILIQSIGNTPLEDLDLQKSEIVRILNNHITNKKSITRETQFMKKLEEAVLESCPEFKLRLEILTLNQIKRIEYEVALLLRAGISPKNIAMLLDRTKSSITDRRRSLTKKIFGDSANNHKLDLLISIL